MVNEIESKLRNIIEKNTGLSIPISEISNSDDLTSVGMNSISYVKIVLAIEREFGFEFDDDSLDFSMFKTINNFLSYVEEASKD